MLLAIDPGACSGWAFFDAGVLVGCGLNEPTKRDVDEVVIEHPVIYPGGRTANPNSIVKLAVNAGEWAGRYRTAGATIKYVLPRTWKGTIDADTCNARIWARLAETERLIVDSFDHRVREFMNRDRLTDKRKSVPGKLHNMLDAIGLGLFAHGRGMK